MNKEVKKTHPSKNFYLYVIWELNNNKSLSDIARKLSISKQQLNYKIYPLKVYKVIEKISYGVWKVNLNNLDKIRSKKKHTLTPSNTPPKTTIRGHAFVFIVRVPKIKGWNMRTNYLRRKNIKFTEKFNGRVETKFKLDKDNFKVWLCNKSIVIYFPKGKGYYDKMAEETELKALHDVKRLIITIQNTLKINLMINNQWQIKPSRKHFSLIKNALAKKYNYNKEKLFVSDNCGLWLLIDNSFNLNELEIIRGDHKRDSKDITDNSIVPFFNDLKNNPELPVLSEMYNLIDEIADNQKMINDNQMIFAENMGSHIKAIQDLGKGVKQLEKTINRLAQTRINDFK